jgi:hypothetical protein
MHVMLISDSFVATSKDEWNDIQRQNSQKSDPIGNRTRSIKMKNDRQSLRKKIIEQTEAGEQVKNDTLLGE